MTESNRPTVVLASGSRARAAMLRDAGVAFDRVPADVDEAAVKDRMLATGNSPAAVAAELACVKALEISRDRPGALVIGADQVLECDGRCFDKPVGIPGARQHLLTFRGRSHKLISAVAVAMNATVAWQHRDEAKLTVRNFSDTFLDAYLDSVGSDVLDSVGAYRLEGMGAQLFERIEGDYFTVLGLPLLPLLGYLRARGVLMS